MGRQRLLGALGLALTLLATLWFLRNFELREVTEPGRIEGEAARNPLYFARRLLTAMNLDTRVAPVPFAVGDLAADAVLVLDTERRRLVGDGLERLLAWVEGGGHLVLRAATPERNRDAEPAPDPLLERLGLRVRYSPDLAYPDAAVHYPFRSGDGRDDTLAIFFVGYYTLQGYRTDDDILFDANGAHVVHREYGAGAITVLSDMNFVRNEALCDQGHAAALWHLVHRVHAPPSRVYLAHSEAYPALPVLIWQRARAVVIATLLLALGLVAYFGTRFGPPRPPLDSARRQLRQHLEASAEYYWRRGEHARLLRPLVEASNRARRQHRRADLPERHPMPPDPEAPLTPQRFTEIVQRLNQPRTRP
ncbi:MAG: DUF4350 domain-containing protein [Thiotrichales bacterium]